MKQYKSHKIVSAFQIKVIEQLALDMRIILRGEDTSIELPLSFAERHEPQAGGYFVEYDDGYQSYSPAQAFEEGYTELGDGATPDKTESATPIMQFFKYTHLPEHLKAVSQPFADLASEIDTELPNSAEKSVSLRKLLEAKDAAVRAAIPE